MERVETDGQTDGQMDGGLRKGVESDSECGGAEEYIGHRSTAGPRCRRELWVIESNRICDKEWHYYVINVEFPVVTLYVDGVTYDPYLVTDDWPIHPSQIDVQLTVGACWQGGEVSKPQFTQYFRGSLSGLTVRPGKIESQKVISCLQACKEGLDITSLESLDKNIKVHTHTHMCAHTHTHYGGHFMPANYTKTRVQRLCDDIKPLTCACKFHSLSMDRRAPRRRHADAAHALLRIRLRDVCVTGELRLKYVTTRCVGVFVEIQQRRVICAVPRVNAADACAHARLNFHFNPAQSILGEDLENINAAVGKVSYINSRQFPTAGIRRLHISTTVQCFGEDTCLSIPDIDAVVMVLQPSEPRITIAGAERLRRPASDLHAPAGLAPFQDLHIASTVTRTDTSARYAGVYGGGVLEEIIHNLDYCDILVLGEELRPEEESLQLEHSSLLGMHLDATNSTSGMSIYGVDSMSNYEQVIRQVRYRHWHPGTLTERRFRLTCSELNGRYTSNEFNLEVSLDES
ncbi:Calsyntenin-2 [Merluccius polli]|uniref:Calsyntenin-2 n=1 Tax=Merluccius polli TaxID=89951 RepID=A0AA47MKJ7_MERPO|nr:Calsyntenin-2 [Merluccius polli]